MSTIQGYLAVNLGATAESSQISEGQAVQISQWAGIRRIIRLVSAYQTRIWLAQGQVNLAARWASDYQEENPREHPREFEDITLLWVLLAQGEFRKALSQARHLRSKAQETNQIGHVIESLLLEAMALFSQNCTDEALLALRESLTIAQQENYVRIFLDAGERTVKLSKQLTISDLDAQLQTYVGQLLRTES